MPCIMLSVQRGQKELRLVIEGDGTISDPPEGTASGWGLRIMGYRAGLLRGCLAWTREADSKVMVVCQIPVDYQQIVLADT